MYTSDLTDAQKAYIRRTIPMEKWRSKYDVFIILDAILYLVRTGCQWRNLPSDFPKWQLVYYYFRKWGVLDEFGKMLRAFVTQSRSRMGQQPAPTLAVIDSQSVKWGLVKTPKGIDGNKRIKGRKRSVATDKNGQTIGVQVVAGNIHDSKAVYALIAMLAVNYPQIKKIMADSAYRGQLPVLLKQTLGIDLEVVASGQKTTGRFIPAKKRWVVERTFAWLESFRRLCRDYEETTQAAEEMVEIASLVLVLGKLHKLNTFY